MEQCASALSQRKWLFSATHFCFQAFHYGTKDLEEDSWYQLWACHQKRSMNRNSVEVLSLSDVGKAVPTYKISLSWWLNGVFSWSLSSCSTKSTIIYCHLIDIWAGCWPHREDKWEGFNGWVIIWQYMPQIISDIITPSLSQNNGQYCRVWLRVCKYVSSCKELDFLYLK